jgi:hypothetical protein
MSLVSSNLHSHDLLDPVAELPSHPTLLRHGWDVREQRILFMGYVCSIYSVRPSSEGKCKFLLLLFLRLLLLTLLSLLLALASVLLDLLWWRVLDQLALLVQPGPFGETVGDVDAALAVEHVQSGG